MKELLAIVFALRKFHHYLWGAPFRLYTDHAALVYLHTQKQLNPMLVGWFELIHSYRFTVFHRPGILNILPDHLSRLFAPPEGNGSGNYPEPSPAEPTIAAVTSSQSPMNHLSPILRHYKETPLADRQAILEKQHALGHLGVTAMINGIHEQGYHWPQLAKQCAQICRSCKQCIRFNISRVGYHPLRPISSDKPFDHVAIDLAGPFPTSSAGNHFLFVLVDVHSRFVILRALPDKKMTTIARALIDIFTLFGFPRIIQSDNGTEFVNKLVQQVTEFIGIDHRLVSPYHPRANGLAERTVQSAKLLLVKLINGVKAEWDLHVPFAQYCLNLRIATIHKSAPFSIMFCRAPNAFDSYEQADDATPTSDDEAIERALLASESIFPGICDLVKLS
ncbi:MAG: DDE-type integrase/transposase/recombinase, partial [Nitrososphaerales archaeon]